MLNSYRIFDYRIKRSFSISFVAHSILELRGKRPAKRQMLNSEQGRPRYMRAMRSLLAACFVWLSQATTLY